jgi:hypothetical protein
MLEHVWRLFRLGRAAPRPIVQEHFEADVAGSLQQYADQTGSDVRYVSKSHPPHYLKKGARPAEPRPSRFGSEAWDAPEAYYPTEDGGAMHRSPDGADRGGDEHP